jgi:hypothetical protein
MNCNDLISNWIEYLYLENVVKVYDMKIRARIVRERLPTHIHVIFNAFFSSVFWNWKCVRFEPRAFFHATFLSHRFGTWPSDWILLRIFIAETEFNWLINLDALFENSLTIHEFGSSKGFFKYCIKSLDISYVIRRPFSTARIHNSPNFRLDFK